MKNNMDKKLFELLQNDRIGSPKKEIEDRLMYTYLLKNGTSTLRQNSFSGFFGWLFSFKNVGIKTALLSCLLIFTFMSSNMRENQINYGSCDSTFIEKALVLDTTSFKGDMISDKNNSRN